MADIFKTKFLFRFTFVCFVVFFFVVLWYKGSIFLKYGNVLFLKAFVMETVMEILNVAEIFS